MESIPFKLHRQVHLYLGTTQPKFHSTSINWCNNQNTPFLGLGLDTGISGIGGGAPGPSCPLGVFTDITV